MRSKEIYYIGQISVKTGVSCKTIRFYEELGLISPPERLNKYRVYNDGHIQQINLVKQAKELGFKLSELKGLFYHSSICSDFPWERVIDMINGKIRENNELMETVSARNNELKKFLRKIEKKCDSPIDSAP